MTAIRKRAAGEARGQFADIINEAVYSETRTVLERHGKPVAAVVPMSDFEALCEIERVVDVVMAERALAEAEAEGFDKLPTLAELLKELGVRS
jgi:prevent-host-death family protein